ncbi:hypothetical protein ACOIDS_28750, partial [Klebsiella pneumoniae]
ADRNRSHWSTSKTPSYTKSVSWQHHLVIPNLNLFYGLTQYFPPLALALLAIAINRLLAHYQKLM